MKRRRYFPSLGMLREYERSVAKDLDPFAVRCDKMRFMSSILGEMRHMHIGRGRTHAGSKANLLPLTSSPSFFGFSVLRISDLAPSPVTADGCTQEGHGM